MDRMFNLNDLTKAQRRIIEEKDKNEITFFRGMGKTTGIFTVACCYAEGNENMNIAIVANSFTQYLKLIDLAKEKYILDVYVCKDCCKITFLNTNSKIIISKFNNRNICTTDMVRRPYSDIKFVYDFIYFDDIYIDKIFMDEVGIFTDYNKVEYLNQQAKQKALFIYTPRHV